MAIISRTAQDKVFIQIKERLDHASTRSFEKAFQNTPSKSAYEVDLGQMPMISSAGLGLLMRLREHVHDDSEITLRNCSKTVRKMLHTAQFQEFFRIS